MKVKIDTREKFTVITPNAENLSDIIAAELSQNITTYLQNDIKNVVLCLKDVAAVEEMAAEILVKLQQQFYENSASLVICEIQYEVEQKLDALGLLELMNTTPTLSEAADIVQMEEIERELLDEEDS